MTERTTLMLLHRGDSHYEVDRMSTERRPIYDDVQSHLTGPIDGLIAALAARGWEVEDDWDEGPWRRLFMKRDRDSS
jgi:hypothetical protein